MGLTKKEKKQKEVLEFESIIKEKSIFSVQCRKMLREYKKQLQEIVSVFEYTEETSYHDIMLYANSKAMLEMPEYQINILITRILVFKSTEEMAQVLNVCRPTLTKYITNIKQTLRKNANIIIESFTD